MNNSSIAGRPEQAAAPGSPGLRPTPGLRTRLLRKLRSAVQVRPLSVAGAVFLIVVIAVAIGAEWLAPHSPLATDVIARLEPPMGGGSANHLLGTDQLGRDILSRIIFGARVSLSVGLAAVVVSGLIGVTMGLLAGYYGKVVANVIMGIADTQLAIPMMLLAVTIMGLLGQTVTNLVIVMGLIGWVQYSRVVRAEVLSLRAREFVQSAEASGATDLRIMLRHILPNVASSVIILGTVQVGRMILLESSLTFLGLGVQASTPTWGGMLQEGRIYMESAWWLAAFPGLAIMATVLSINLGGDWLRDELDPRLRGR